MPACQTVAFYASPRPGWHQTYPSCGPAFVYFSDPCGANCGVDFGFQPDGTVTGAVFDDSNASGNRDGAETGMGGWTVYVDSVNNGSFDAGERYTVTDVSGNYTFDHVAPGCYPVRVAGKPHWQQTYPAGGGTAWAYVGESSPSACVPDFGLAPVNDAVAAGTVYEAAANGTPASPGGGVGGVIVFADANGNGSVDTAERWTRTADDGSYTLDGLPAEPAGSTHLRVVVTSGWQRTAPAGDGSRTPTFPADGSAATGNDFGLTPTTRATGTVFADRTPDGVRAPAGEEGLSGWTVYYDANGNGELDEGERRTATNTNGAYTLTGLPLNDCQAIRVVGQPDWWQSLPADGAGRYIYLTDTAPDASGQDFGLVRGSGTVSGTVFKDFAGDGGAMGAGDAPLAGWRAYCDTNGDGLWQASEPYGVSDATGAYTIPGVPMFDACVPVRVERQDGWAQTYPGPGGSVFVSISPAYPNACGIDFGAAPLPAAPTDVSAAPASDHAIAVSWAGGGSAPPPAGFEVQRSAVGTPDATDWATIRTAGAGDAAWTDAGRAADTTYYYRVRATTLAGPSDWSPAAATTYVTPALSLAAPADAPAEGDEVPFTLGGTGMDSIASVSFGYGDGSTQPFGYAPDAVSHTFADNGTYTVTATATTWWGAALPPVSCQVTVTNADPSVEVVGPAGGVEGTAVTFFAYATDPAGGADPLTYSWAVTKNGNPYSLPAGTVTTADALTFTPDDNGTYAATPTVGDGDGGTTTSGPAGVAVASRPRTVGVDFGGGATSRWDVNPGQPVTVGISVSADPHNEPLTGLTIDWGIPGRQPVPLAPDATSATLDGGYPQGIAGHTITVTAKDADGGSTAYTATAYAVTNYFNDFEDGAELAGGDGSGWSSNTINVVPAVGPYGNPNEVGYTSYLGGFDDAQSLTLRALPTHTTIRGSLRLIALNDWDGDPFTIRARQGADGQTVDVGTVTRTTVGNRTEEQFDETWSNGYGYVTGGDGSYDVSFAFLDSSGELTLEFDGGEPGTDKKWAVDNVRIEAGMELDVTVDGLPDGPAPTLNKTDPGAFIPVTTDPAYPNLVPVTVTKPDWLSAGNAVKLTVTGDGSDQVRLYNSPAADPAAPVYPDNGQPLTVQFGGNSATYWATVGAATAAKALHIIVDAAAPAVLGGGTPGIGALLASSGAAAGGVNAAIGVYKTEPGKTGQEVAADKKGVETAYVPVNRDNDNYAVEAKKIPGNPPKWANQRPVPDYEKSNDGVKGVSGENDLVRLVFHDLAPHAGAGAGEYKIGGLGVGVEGKYLRFFEKDDKTGLVKLTGMTFDLKPGNDYFVWVEARPFDVNHSGFTLSVQGPKAAPRSTVRLEVFEFAGPQNVPGRGKYFYTLNAATTFKADAAMWAADNGAQKTNDGGVLEHDGPNGSKGGFGVLFDDGAQVENVIFKPADGFQYTLPVNVVKVEHAKSGATAEVTLHPDRVRQSPADFKDGKNVTGRVHIDSADLGAVGQHAMDFESNVTLTGPSDGHGGMRGLRFIEVGFMQTGGVTTRRYTLPGGDAKIGPDDASRIGENKNAAGQAVSYPLLDTINHPNAPGGGDNERPWYASKGGGLYRAGATMDWPAPGTGAYTTASDGGAVTAHIVASDTPWGQTAAPQLAAETVTLQMDFTAILAAHTIDAVNGSETLYFSMAEAPWTFNGSGTIDKKTGVWHPKAGTTGNYSDPVQKRPAVDLLPSQPGTAVLGGRLTGDTLVMNEALNAKSPKKHLEIVDTPIAWQPPK